MRFLLLLLALTVCAPDLAAQTLRVEGGEEYAASALLHQIVSDPPYLLIDRDTVLPESFRTPGDLVVIGADVRLEGRIEGAIAVVGGELFIRPGAEVQGDIAAVGGAVYPSGLANTGEILELPTDVRVELERVGDLYAVDIIPPPAPTPALQFPGLFGLEGIAYDRVDGLTVRAGIEGGLSGTAAGPRVAAWATYHSARGAFGGGGEADIPLGGNVRAVASAARLTPTNEEWIRSDLLNSLSAFFLRSDVRNYWQSEAVSLSLVRRRAQPLIGGEHFWGPSLTLLASRDRSLPASDPWSLFGDEWRPNPPIADGNLVSLTAGTTLEWKGTSTMFDGEVAVEWAPPGWGDFEFAQWVADGRWAMQALRGHTITVYARGMAPLGVGAPPQRWSIVGGSGTLPTLELGAFRGDHLVFIESSYTIPFPRVTLPLAGSPSLLIRHAVGSAWVGDDAPAWVQNLGIGARFLLLDTVLFVNPGEETLQPTLSVGVAFPG